MTIQLTFDSFDDYCAGIRKLADSMTQEPAAETEFVPEPEKPIVITEEPAEKAPEAVQEPEKAEQKEPKAEQAVTEDFRVEVRRILSRINKTTGTKLASKLIKEVTGKERLTEVALEDLPALMEKAKEVLDAQ